MHVIVRATDGPNFYADLFAKGPSPYELGFNYAVPTALSAAWTSGGYSKQEAFKKVSNLGITRFVWFIGVPNFLTVVRHGRFRGAASGLLPPRA